MKYTAISIGPIYPTILQAKSTKAFWTASYLFSYIMKNLLRELNLPVEQFVSPYFEQTDLSNDHFPQTGLFHDQFIVQGTPNVQQAFDRVIQQLADQIAENLRENYPDDRQKVREYCKAYFNLHIVSGYEMKEGGENPSVIHAVSPLISSIELINRVNPLSDSPYLKDFLELRPDKKQPGSNYNFLHKKAFPSKRKFPSTAEIATEELWTKKESFYSTAVNEFLKDDDEDGQLKFFNTVRFELEKSKNSRYRKYLKHYAIVEADGDGFGKFIEKLCELDKKEPLNNGESRMRRFSENTLKFSRAATVLINGGSRKEGKLENSSHEETPTFSLKIRGHAVYAGGDDLLFFSPVAYSTFDEGGKLVEQETIFDLIDTIDRLFDHYFTNDLLFAEIIEDHPVSMSYGIAISYYKFPLAEAKQMSHNALAEIAKKTPRKHPIKNRVVLEFRGHSGDTFSLNFRKHPSRKIYKAFKELRQSVINDSNYINSLIPTLDKNIGTFHGIGCSRSNTNQSEEALHSAQWDHFFKENFNESVHTTGAGENKQLIPFLERLKALFKAVYLEQQITDCSYSHPDGDSSEKNKKNWELICNMLKFISFIHNKEN